MTLVGKVEGNGENSRVVIAQLKPNRQNRLVDVVELDAKGSALADFDREVEAFVLAAEVVEEAKGLPSEVADLWVVTLLLEFVDHDDRDHHRLFFETEQGLGVTQQDGCVEDVCSKLFTSLRACGGLLGGGGFSHTCSFIEGL